MDTPSDLDAAVRHVLNHWADAFPAAQENIVVERIFDAADGHYQVTLLGWKEWRRIHQVYLHIDIRDGKVWIEHDGTHDGIANDLIAVGVAREDIVLAFLHPFERQFLPEFAAA